MSACHHIELAERARSLLTELGLADHFATILCSAEVGAAKPDQRIFAEASARLGVDPARILHVGDSLIDDYAGAGTAGLRAVLTDRERSADGGIAHAIHGLHELTDP